MMSTKTISATTPDIRLDEKDDQSQNMPTYATFHRGYKTKSDSTTSLTKTKSSQSIDKKAWEVKSQSRQTKVVIFDAYLGNILIRLERLDQPPSSDDIKGIITTSQSYLRTLSKDAVARMFIGNIVMLFRNSSAHLTGSKLHTLQRAIQKFYKSTRDIDSYRQFLATIHAIGITPFKTQD